MYAVVKTGGKQYRVEKEEVVLVEKINANDGDQVVLNNVLMIGEGKKVTLGNPMINDAAVMAQVIRQTRGPKITMIYKRRRKNSRRKQGHKQDLTLLKIIDIAEKDGSKYYITPLVGSGLWGPIWGFVAFEKDCNTVFGASFDHKTETPGLGAEIRESFFEDEFIGKKILDENSSFVSIDVVKGGAKEGSYHQVDGITGGTITSDGVTNMLKTDLEIYNNYFKTIRN